MKFYSTIQQHKHSFSFSPKTQAQWTINLTESKITQSSLSDHQSITFLVQCPSIQLMLVVDKPFLFFKYNASFLSVSLSLSQRSPLLSGVIFQFEAVFLLNFYNIFLEQVFPLTSAATVCLQGSKFLWVLTSFLLSYVGALSSIIISHRGLLFFKE